MANAIHSALSAMRCQRGRAHTQRTAAQAAERTERRVCMSRDC